MRPLELKALARSLGANRLSATDYASAVNNYIQRNIRTEFRFGLSKGALGAVVDQSGTAFDQAHLMVELLREGGIAAGYTVGTVTLTATQFGNWTGLVTPTSTTSANQVTAFSVDAHAACQLLADGGIPSNLGAADCSSASGTLSTVTMGHIWVSANGLSYDPSYKANDLWTRDPGLVTSACGGTGDCSSAAIAGLQSGATVTSTSLANPNVAALTSALTSQAVAAETYIKGLSAAAGRHMMIEEVAGGRRIAATQPMSGSLPYSVSPQFSWSGNIPDGFRTLATVILPGAFTQRLFLDEIAGRRVRITSAYALIVENQVLVAAPNIAMQSGINPNVPSGTKLTIQIDHPYANTEIGSGGPAGSYQDENEQFAARFGDFFGEYLLVIQSGYSAGSLVAYTTDLIKAPPRLPPFTGGSTVGTTYSGVYYGVKSCNDFKPETMALIAASQAAQTSKAQTLLEGLDNVHFENHHTIGFVSETLLC